MTTPSPAPSPFGDLLDEEWTPRHDPERRRRGWRAAGIIVLVVVILLGGGAGGYIWWAASAPLAAPTMTSNAPAVKPGPAATIAMPADGEALLSVSGGDAFLGSDAKGDWKASGGNSTRPIASITKIITALVVLDAHPLASGDDRGPTVTFTKADSDLYDQYYVQGATIARMPAGTTMSLHDALTTMLLPSAANYAEALSRWAYGSTGAFVSAARSWLSKNGLNQTTIVDPTGLDARNTSTPTDLVALGRIASSNPALATIVATRSASFNATGDISNTNDLLGTLGIDGLKTGNLGEGTFNLLFTSKLDVTSTLDVTGVSPLRVTGVVLGGESHDSVDHDVTAMLQSIRDGFHKVAVSTRGQQIGTITTPWGASASVVVARDASILTWSDTPITVSLDTTAPTSYTDGQVVGQATWTAGSQVATVDLKISGSIEQPTMLWRLTHPTELG